MNKQEAKADAGKLELDLVPMQIVRDIAQIRMYGNAKYGDPDNWKQVELRRYVNALLRHTLAFLEDNSSIDDESGIEHYKHMACNMAFICHMMQEKKPIVRKHKKDCEHEWFYADTIGENDIYICRKCNQSKTESVRSYI